jgi:hypothetical protein
MMRGPNSGLSSQQGGFSAIASKQRVVSPKPVRLDCQLKESGEATRIVLASPSRSAGMGLATIRRKRSGAVGAGLRWERAAKQQVRRTFL